MAPMSSNVMEAGATQTTEQGHGGREAGSAAKDEDSKLYEFKEQLLLLSTLVATVTYVAGLNLPGGSWEQDDPGGHMAGDPILRDTHYRRYLAFYYCNATALAASLVVSLILIILPKKKQYWTLVLRMVMVLDLLGLMGAYGAGSCRDAFTTVYAAVAFFILVLIIIYVFLYVLLNRDDEVHPNSTPTATPSPSTPPIPTLPTPSPSLSPPPIPTLSTPTPSPSPSPIPTLSTPTPSPSPSPIPTLSTPTTSPSPFPNPDSYSYSHSISSSSLNRDSNPKPKFNLNPHSNPKPDSNSSPDSDIKPNSIFISKSTSFVDAVKRVQAENDVVRSLADVKMQAEKEKIDVLMLLATFAVTITYVAGLSPPGGFWSSTQDGHRLSDPVLQARGRYRAFFVCNTTSFAVSLLIIVLLLEKKLLNKELLKKELLKKELLIITVRFALYVLIAVALLGLMVAYAAGSCRETDNTVFVLTLTAVVPICVCLQLAFVTCTNCWKRPATKFGDVLGWFKTPRGTSTSTDIQLHIHNTRYLVMLLATLVVTITYQAGLDPPGGLWLDSQDGHTIGHPVLQTTHPTRYQVFFYSNSAAFVTSLVVIMMLQSKYLLTRHTLEAALVLDLFGLITAYGAGSTRDVNASFYIIALAGIVLVYVIVHITIIDHAPEPEGGDVAVKHLDDKRKVLLLVAILAATLTYQAGLTPPGGFWLADDQGHGRRAGFPVLHDNYPRRYHAFFYCNGASFMASVTLILLLVNPKLYRPGIRCYALYVCMLVGMVGLMGAYAAGSSRHLKTSIYVLSLVVAVSVFIALLVPLFRYICKDNSTNNIAIPATATTAPNNTSNAATTINATATANNIAAVAAATSTTTIITTKENDKLEYLMLLGILGASMTYQTGLKPPGGLWQDNTNGHSAGNPILHDINKHRYNAFFYSNSTSFMASIVVVVMLLPLTIQKKFHGHNLPLWPMHTAILLDMISLLVGYAAGSTRKWETSRHVMFLIIPVLLYIAVYALASIFYHRKKQRVLERSTLILPQLAESSDSLSGQIQ